LAIQKSLPKNLKKINSDKDLESEVTDICNTLKDISKLFTHFHINELYVLIGADWKKRVEANQKIQGIAFMFDAVCSGQTKINVNNYIQQVNKFGTCLGA
jgi:hypothetical protein